MEKAPNVQNDGKTCFFPLEKKWWVQIAQGLKSVELRKANEHWQSRITGASHAVFTKGPAVSPHIFLRFHSLKCHGTVYDLMFL